MKNNPSNALIENIPVALIIFSRCDAGYHIDFINEIAEEEYGLNKKNFTAMLNNNLAGFAHPEDRDRISLMLYKSGVTGGIFSEIVRILKKNSRYSWTELRLSSASIADDQCQFHLVLMDIDDQIKATSELERTYEELMGILDNTPGGIIVFDTKNDRTPFVSLATSGMYRLLEGPKDAVLAAYGSSFLPAVHPDDRNALIRQFEDSLRNLSKIEITLRLLTLTGNYVLVDAVGVVTLSKGRRRIYMTFTNSSNDKKDHELLQHVLDIFVAQEYDHIGIIDLQHHSYRVLSSNSSSQLLLANESSDYDHDIKKMIDDYMSHEDGLHLWDTLQLSHLQEKMTLQKSLELFVTMHHPYTNELRYKKIWISWIDKEVQQLAFVISDYTEIQKKEKEHQEMLRSALRAAEQANVAKSEFLSRMSHDIRTPLTAIIGFTKIILKDGDGTVETKRRLKNVEASSEFLLSLINDVLEMSRIESGKYSLQHKPFSLSSLIDGVVSIISSQCETKGLHFHYSLSADVDKCYLGDQLKLQQVLVNILGNSVKFTPAGGTLTLQIEKHASYGTKSLLRFVVTDTGIGIAPEFIPHLFDAFAQENKWDSNHTGSGLGLAICKNIVTLMNGTIEVHSEKDKGSTFIVDLQLDTDDIPACVCAKTLSDIPTDAESAYDFSGKHILLAEDHPMNQEIAKYILENAGFTVHIADNGRIACERFAASEENYYAVVILDIRMPIMDGLEAARTIRSMVRPDAASVPLIAMSANAFEEDISKSLASGINAHLTKPINPDQLFKTLAEYIFSL